MAKIGPRTIHLIKEQIEHLIDEYSYSIDDAYLRADKDLTVSIAVKLTPDNKGTKVKTTISFVAEKISDEMTVVFDENQINFAFDDRPPPPPPTVEEIAPDDDEALRKLTQE